MSVLPNYALDLLNKIAKAEGFTDYKLDFEAGSNHGDGFVGVLISVVIIGTKNGVPNTDLRLLCKLAPINAARRAEFLSETVFEREALAYNKILPMLLKFQAERGLSDGEGFHALPKCFVAVADEEINQLVIILEDLRVKGFVMHPKEESAPADHAHLVIENLAKLHAISFAIKDQRPDIYEELRKVDDILTVFYKSTNLVKLWVCGLDRAIATLRNERHVEIIKEVKKNFVEYFIECVKPPIFEPFGVIGHGDCWKNNMLFQYHDQYVSQFKIISIATANFCS